MWCMTAAHDGFKHGDSTVRNHLHGGNRLVINDGYTLVSGTSGYLVMGRSMVVDDG